MPIILRNTIHLELYPQKPQYKDIKRRTIKILQRIHIINIVYCLNVPNAHLKLSSPISGYRGEQYSRLHVNYKLDQSLFKFQKNRIFGFSLPVSSQSILKYAYMLDVLIAHIVHMTYFDYTLSILQNFEKTI